MQGHLFCEQRTGMENGGPGILGGGDPACAGIHDDSDRLQSRNLTPEGIECKKRVRKLVQGTGWKSVTRAMEFMREIEAFKNAI